MSRSVYVPAKAIHCKRTPRTPEQSWTVWSIVAALLLAYPLSFGPVMLLYAYDVLPASCLLLYFPLMLLGQVLHPIGTLM
ncbi:MAG: hypothetical protein JWN70_3274, partial [Planctomycetaceae bacterium]|nr:hypothetical protein [Planctomycetaceae bacterium]